MTPAAVHRLLEHLDQLDPGCVMGVYLYGSAAVGALHPDSDIDLLVITRRSLSHRDRRGLVDLLLGVSGWRGHAEAFPTAAHRRPLDVTVMVSGELEQMTAAPVRDFQYGEWLRGQLISGRLPEPARDPDTLVVLATALSAHRVLRGPALRQVLPPIPEHLLHTALVAHAGKLMDELEDDQRNVLLSLARTLSTIMGGRILSKDEAALTVSDQLEGSQRQLLLRARASYLGHNIDGAVNPAAAGALAAELYSRIRRSAEAA